MTRRAFTLIEIMISVAILAIVMACLTVAHLGLGDLRRESDFRFSEHNARDQLRRLQTVAFDALPPQVLRADPQGWVQLGQADLVAGSLKVLSRDGLRRELEPTEIDLARGRLRLKAGERQEVLVTYAFHLCDREEAHVVPSDGQVPLWNTPARRLEGACLIQGERRTPLTTARLSPDGNFLELGPGGPRVVSVDYRGARVGNVASGEFLNEQLEAVDAPSPLKLLRIQETYAGVGSFSLTLLRCAP